MLTARQEWEMALASTQHSISILFDLVKDNKVNFMEDKVEVYKELDDINITINYLRILTNNRQYLCEEDYDYLPQDSIEYADYD